MNDGSRFDTLSACGAHIWTVSGGHLIRVEADDTSFDVGGES